MGDIGYLIGRMILTFIAFCAAFIGALVTLGIGFQKHLEDAADPGSAMLIGGVLIVVGAILGVKLIFPAFLIILATEAFAWRSIWLYLALGVGVALATEWVLLLFDGDEIHPSPSKLLIASGLIGGFIYWLIAGRSAGRILPPSPPVIGTIDRP